MSTLHEQYEAYRKSPGVCDGCMDGVPYDDELIHTHDYDPDGDGRFYPCSAIPERIWIEQRVAALEAELAGARAAVEQIVARAKDLSTAASDWAVVWKSRNRGKTFPVDRNMLSDIHKAEFALLDALDAARRQQ